MGISRRKLICTYGTFTVLVSGCGYGGADDNDQDVIVLGNHPAGADHFIDESQAAEVRVGSITMTGNAGHSHGVTLTQQQVDDLVLRGIAVTVTSLPGISEKTDESHVHGVRFNRVPDGG